MNGQSESLDADATLADLVHAHGLTPERVAIEVNRQLVPRARYAETVLAEGDAVEIVTFVGGG